MGPQVRVLGSACRDTGPQPRQDGRGASSPKQSQMHAWDGSSQGLPHVSCRTPQALAAAPIQCQALCLSFIWAEETFPLSLGALLQPLGGSLEYLHLDHLDTSRQGLGWGKQLALALPQLKHLELEGPGLPHLAEVMLHSASLCRLSLVESQAADRGLGTEWLQSVLVACYISSLAASTCLA